MNKYVLQTFYIFWNQLLKLDDFEQKQAPNPPHKK